jgi:excisionase family DNA binding protein
MTAAYSRATASEESGISEDMLDRAIKTGALKAKQLGRRVLILPKDLDAYLESLPDVETKKAS